MEARERVVNELRLDEVAVGEQSQGVMPGVLEALDSQTKANPNMNTADKTNMTMNGESSKKRKVEDMVNGDAHVNGEIPTTNGVYANGAVADPFVSPQNLAAAIRNTSGQLPPEIPHITQGYLPLSKLITRLAQETFNGLTQTINQMADIQPQQSNTSPHINGAGFSQAAEANFEKKNVLWDFAQERRANFIKVLVLSQWSRNVEAVGKVIDLNVWLRGQKDLYHGATNWLGELKRLLAPMKLPSPDLKTALEALSTGKAEWLSDVSIVAALWCYTDC